MIYISPKNIITTMNENEYKRNVREVIDYMKNSFNKVHFFNI